MKYLFLSFIIFSSCNSYAWSPQNFKKPSASELRKILTSLQYNVTQEDGTERPFSNPFHDKKEKGIYVDVVSGERFLVLWINTIQELDGQVSRKQFAMELFRQKRIEAFLESE